MKVFAENASAYHHYEILEKFEAGLVLAGMEAKAVAASKANLKGSYVKPLGTELYLVNMHIAPYQPKNTPEKYDPLRSRKLLLTKKEILYLIGKIGEKGLTLLPLRLYTKGRKIKAEIALARGKKKFDKREKMKKEEFRRELKNQGQL